MSSWRSRSRYSPSKERDAETGLDYFGARYYSGAQGRFISPDPVSGKISNPQSFNAYSYSWNNPLRYTDPTGMVVSWEDSEAGEDGYTDAERRYLLNMTSLLGSKNKKARARGERMKSNYDRLQAADEVFHVVEDNGTGSSSGMLDYRGEPGNLYVSLKGDASAYGALTINQKLGHEFEHGVQFLDGLLGFKKQDNGRWLGLNDDRVDEANAFIAGFEAEGVNPQQRQNPFLKAIDQAIPFGEDAAKNTLGKIGPYQNRSGVQMPVTKEMMSPDVYAKPRP
jgi:RHS repeat-associated protein